MQTRHGAANQKHLHQRHALLHLGEDKPHIDRNICPRGHQFPHWFHHTRRTSWHSLLEIRIVFAAPRTYVQMVGVLSVVSAIARPFYVAIQR